MQRALISAASEVSVESKSADRPISTGNSRQFRNRPKIIQFAGVESGGVGREEGERTSVGANGTFAAVSNVKRRMLASTDAYITSTWDDLAGGFQWGLTPPVGSIPCYANLSTVGLGVVDRGSKIIPRSAASLLFLRFIFFFISPAVSPFPRSSATKCWPARS